MSKNDDKYGLTLEDRQKLTAHNIEKLGYKVKEYNRELFEKDIALFLKKKQCLTLATVNPDGTPHQSILDYISDGIDLYIASEGGDKFRNLENSNKVSISIGFSDGTIESEYGLLIDGEIKVYRAPHPKYATGMLKLKDFVMEWSKKVQPLENILSKAINSRLMIVKPNTMIYMNMKEGYPFYKWEKDNK